jgi:hypothetical protein
MGFQLIAVSMEPRYNMESSDPAEVAGAVRSYYDEISTEALLSLYEKFGGRKAFTQKKLSDGMEELKKALLSCDHFSAEEHEALFHATPKIDRYAVYNFATQPYAYSNFDNFMRLWQANKHAMVSQISGYNTYELDDFLAANIWEGLPMEHELNCRGDEPGNALAHYGCKKPQLFHADRNLKFTLANKKKFEAHADPKVIEFIQENAFDFTTDMRADYAASLIVREDHWEKLANDTKRPVLNALVTNPLLPTSVAKDIILQHKTGSLREEIAKKTVDVDLLEFIWGSTKSESIREAVKQNSLFRDHN